MLVLVGNEVLDAELDVLGVLHYVLVHKLALDLLQDIFGFHSTWNVQTFQVKGEVVRGLYIFWMQGTLLEHLTRLIVVKGHGFAVVREQPDFLVHVVSELGVVNSFD